MNKKIRFAILGILLAIAGGLALMRYLDEREVARIKEAEAKTQAAARAWMAANAKQQKERSWFPDFAMQQVPPGYPRPDSDWLAKEKAFYEKILQASQFDVLVVPFQVRDWAFSRATRSLMTAELAAMLAQDRSAKIPDPYLVGQALGDGLRQFKREDVYRLASAIGAKRIIWTFAGHDQKGKMAVTVRLQDRLQSEPFVWDESFTTKQFENIGFDDERSPIAAYEALLPEIVKAIGLDPAALASQMPESRLNLAALPESPLRLMEGDDNPARDVYSFLLLAGLTPDYIARTKERFVEKAFLALARMSPASPEYRALRARAYLGMGFRIAAIKTLGEPQNDEEKGLLAALNGNLIELREFAAKEKNQIKRLLLKLDEVNIATHYGVINSNRLIEDLKAMSLPGITWPFLVMRTFTEDDDWVQHENAQVKLLLDLDFPVKGYSLEDIMRAGAPVGDMSKLQTTMELSVFNHGRKYIEMESAKWCCQFSASRPGILDFMDLLQAMGHDNLLRRIRFQATTQGVPDRAMQYANTLDAVYKGYPYYAVERSNVESLLAAKAGEAEKQGLLKSAYQNAFNAMYWEQGQSYISNMAQQQVNNVGIRDYGHHDNFYYRDIPFRPYYWTWAAGGDPQIIGANNEAAVKNAAWEFNAVKQLAWHYQLIVKNEASVKKLMQSLDERFIGAPQRNELLATEELARGDLKAASARYRENIRLVPNYWTSYHDLGKLMFESGEVREASKLFWSYPGFKKDSGENRVFISNIAFDVGSYYFWSGHFDLAQVFYKMAAAQGTGASSDMTSALRLRLLAGDFNGALLGAVERVRRYNDSYAYRDYLGMLHASGHSKDAWAAFGTLVRELPKPQLWETALVGHHIDGATEAEVAEWLKQDNLKHTAERGNSTAKYMLRFATTDRTPSKEAPDLINNLDRPVWQLEGQMSFVVRASESGMGGAILGPGATGGNSLLPLGVLPHAPKHRVKSNLAYFAEAHRAIKLGDFPAAKKIFEEAVTLYDITGESVFMLPYYALAVAKTGDTAAFEATLQRFKTEQQRFDYQLAKAVLTGVAGKTDEALHALSLARYRRPHTESRPLLTQYTYGEICELLATTTANAKIRGVAVDWARQSQKFEPWQSWSYAIEAALTTNAADRKRAIAMLQYLDPKSERLSAFRKPEIDEAVRAYSTSNPFLRKPVGPVRENAV